MKRKRLEVVYFVGCKSSFLISSHQQASGVLRDLVAEGVDFAVLGPREWCCGLPLKRSGRNEEFENCRQHNLKEIQRLGGEEIIFNCPACYSMWQQEYQPEGVELIYRESSN